MKRVVKILCLVGVCVGLCSCSGQRAEQAELRKQLASWQGREIVFPSDVRFTIQGKEEVGFSVSDSTYKILTYLDSVGCSSCKLNLPRWKEWMSYLHDEMKMNVQFLFFFHPNDVRELKIKMKYDDFTYPVCFDSEDALNRLNHFPSDMQFQTFLLDPANKVVAVGNPIDNPRVKELYLRTLAPELKQKPMRETEISVASLDINFGTFPFGQRCDTTIYIRNVGEARLVAFDMRASCGCTEVEYDRHPISPGDDLALHIVYEDSHRGFFDKTVLLYCNVAESPLVFRVRGCAE